jgi:SAM-dependent methyltransferase
VSLDSFYATRFPEADRAAKDAIWQVLCARFFQRYVRPDDVVVDIGPGLGEFLRHIKCGTRIAVDIEHLTGRTLPPGTREVLAPSHELASHIAAGSVDVVFCSNFFEHLPDKATFLATLGQILTVLKPGGRLLALQPNIRFVGGAYWDPVDHHLPLTHVTLIEASQSVGYEVEEVVPRFLPYTTRSAIPQSPWLVRLYLAVRPIWRVMGQQTWFVARKPRNVIGR